MFFDRALPLGTCAPSGFCRDQAQYSFGGQLFEKGSRYCQLLPALCSARAVLPCFSYRIVFCCLDLLSSWRLRQNGEFHPGLAQSLQLKFKDHHSHHYSRCFRWWRNSSRSGAFRWWTHQTVKTRTRQAGGRARAGQYLPESARDSRQRQSERCESVTMAAPVASAAALSFWGCTAPAPVR